jgi:hypothetical protein
VFKYHHIILLHHILLAVPLPLVLASDGFFVAYGGPVVDLGDFSAYEGLFKAAMDGTSGLRCCAPALDEPGAHMGWASCIKLLEAQDITALF